MIGTPSLATPVSIANGGTNATTAPAALASLGAAPAGIYALRTTDAAPRTNTTAYANDDVLLFNLGAGTFFVEANGIFRNESGTPGSRIRMAFSGTKTTVGGSLYVNAGGGAVTGYFSPDYSGSDIIFSGWSNAGDDVQYRFIFVFVSTVAGVLSVQWAQETSSADDTVLRAGSSLIATPLA